MADLYGDSVWKVATIKNEAAFEHWGKVVPDVVLTEERVAHICEGHEQDYRMFGNMIASAIESPTYILEDEKNAFTALFIKKISDSNLNVVVKLKLKSEDASDLMSSVITMYRLGDKTLKRLLKRNNVLYNADEVCYNVLGKNLK